MKRLYQTGEILFNETNKMPFITDGIEDGDGLNVVIGFTKSRGELVLCRTSGRGNYCTSAEVRSATEEEKQFLMHQIAIAKDIPFYSCLP